MFEFFNQSEVIKIVVIVGSMALFFVGLFGLLTRKHFIKIFISVSIMESSLFLFFIGLTYQKGLGAPIIDATKNSFSNMNDPVPHAMILTAIVISMAVLALGVSFAIEYYKLTGKKNIDKMNELRY